MAYRDDETPESGRDGSRAIFLIGFALASVVCGAVASIGFSKGQLWIAYVMAIAVFGLIWLVLRQSRKFNAVDEFYIARRRWSASYGLGAALFIILPTWLVLRHLDSLPMDWQSHIARILPHPEAFSGGVFFTYLIILICRIAASAIWKLRHQ